MEEYKKATLENLEKQLRENISMAVNSRVAKSGHYQVSRAIGSGIFVEQGVDFYKIVYGGNSYGQINIKIPFEWCIENNGSINGSGKPIFTKVYFPSVYPDGLYGTTTHTTFSGDARIADSFGKTIKFDIPVRLSFEMEVSKELAISFGAEIFGASLSQGVTVVFRATDYVDIRGRFHINDIGLNIDDADCYANFDDIDMTPANAPSPQGSNGSSGSSGSSGGGSGGTPSGGQMGDASGSGGSGRGYTGGGNDGGEGDSGYSGYAGGTNGGDNGTASNGGNSGDSGNGDSDGGDSDEGKNDRGIEIIITIHNPKPEPV